MNDLEDVLCVRGVLEYANALVPETGESIVLYMFVDIPDDPTNQDVLIACLKETFPGEEKNTWEVRERLRDDIIYIGAEISTNKGNCIAVSSKRK